MKLKEIKPGMVIHCKTHEDIKALGDAGVHSALGRNVAEYMEPECYVIIRENLAADWDKNLQTVLPYGEITEFSDLIMPELTAEEVLSILAEIKVCAYSPIECKDCPLTKENNESGLDLCCIENFTANEELVISICQKWKSEHERKYDHERKESEIETEWFWRGMIFKIHEDGCYYQIKNDTCVYDTGCESRESAEEYMAGKLKEYCKTHGGEHIAKVERVCRVKAVE